MPKWSSTRTLRFKLLFGFLLLVIPLVAFMIYNNLYAINVVRNQVAQSNKNMISLYMGQIDRNLEEAEKYLYTIAALETGLMVLEQPREQNADRYAFEKIQLYRMMLKELSNYKTMDMFFIYSPINDDLMTVNGNEITYNAKIETESSLHELFQDKETIPDKQWFVHKVGNVYYLISVIKYGDMYIGALGNTEQLMVPLNLLDLGKDGQAFLVTETFEPMKDQEALKLSGIDLQFQNADYKLTGSNDEFLLMGELSSRGKFGLAAIIPDSMVLENLPFLRRIISMISIGALVILPIILFLLRKIVLVPVNRIIMAMRRIEDGNLDVRIRKQASAFEFEVMNESFNRMINQIQQLKVNVLEEQLNRQKAELKHLQMQINPHFFLNSLNIIYNLAQVKDYYLIQEMTHCLVQYFRFMSRSSTLLVSLHDEIEHTFHYLRIQELRFPDALTFRLDVPDSLAERRVPPLLIQAFAENAIKYALNTDRPTHIAILAEESDDRMLHIRIADTGDGFKPEMLSLLQRGIDVSDEDGNHIGIWNARQRLGLLYKGLAGLAFSNAEQAGAVVDIWLPLHEEDQSGGDRDETAVDRR
jgi:two-component system sensor histidine kinase YesM